MKLLSDHLNVCYRNQSTNVTDRRTDRQTDGRMDGQTTYKYRATHVHASFGKSTVVYCKFHGIMLTTFA